METLFYLTFKYWKKHLKNAMAMIFSGVLLTAIIFVMLMSERENYAKDCHRGFDINGNYEVLIANADDDILSKAVEGRNSYKYSAMYVYGMLGNGKTRFAYGTVEDKENLLHIPLDEGRMPETKDEIIADRGALDALFWVGKCGNTITLDGRTFTVVGIINENYGQYREGSQLNKTFDDESLPDYKGCYIPLIFVGESNEQPLYRIDMLGNIFNVSLESDSIYREARRYLDNLNNFCDIKTQWIDINYNGEMVVRYTDNIPLFLCIAWLGAAISALSVFSVLRNVFTERKGKIEVLKRLGMSKSKLMAMLGIECALFAAADVILGIAVGVAAYGGIFAFKTNVLGEAPYSGFTDLVFVKKSTLDPFLFAGIISAAIIVGAYILNALSVRIKRKVQRKTAKPRKLSKCFSRIFGQRAITVTQTAALSLICFSVLFGYLYCTDNGKTGAKNMAYSTPSSNFNVNGLNMENEGIAEYYSCKAPTTSGLGGKVQFESVRADFLAGIDDGVMENLPEYALASGYLAYTFISSEQPNDYINEIDLSDNDFRQGLLALSGEEYQNFFDEGQLGSEHLYKIGVKLSSENVIKRLLENVKDGAINLEKINSGEEIIVAYQGVKPPFEVGETITLNSAAVSQTGFGIGDLKSAKVRVCALIQIVPENDRLINEIVRNRKEQYNFLTTASGAAQMGLHCAKYTKIYCTQPIDGGLIPSSAQMEFTSLERMKHDYQVQKATQYASVVLILIVMSLLGFAAYFNGIGMKIRLKSYNISVVRAIGTPVSEVRKRLLVNSVKIPIISTAVAYVGVKITQLLMKVSHSIYVSMFDSLYGTGNGDYNISFDGSADYKQPFDEILAKETMRALKNNFFLDRVMWQANAEIPALILLAVLCGVTFILTAIALKKFKSNIAGDLNEGRTRQ